MPDKYHTAEYFRERRRQQRNNRQNYDRDDPFYNPRFVEVGRAMSAMMRTPTNVPGYIPEIPDDPRAVRTAANETLCACGCGLRHNNAVSRVIGTDLGKKRVLWYRTMICRNKHAGVAPAGGDTQAK